MSLLSQIGESLSNYYNYILGRRSTSQTVTAEQSLDDKPCRYNLSDDTSSTLTLSDGRKLGYAQYGSTSTTSKTIFWLHGFPGSRIEGTLWDETAKNQGARIIAIDRPGHGWSSPQPNRKMLDHVKDVQMLAEELGVEEYGLAVGNVVNYLQLGAEFC